MDWSQQTGAVSGGARIQLIFVTIESGLVVVDYVDAAGTPFTVSVRLPYTAAWAALATEAVLRRWAADGAIIDMLKIERRDCASVRFSDDERRLQLALSPST